MHDFRSPFVFSRTQAASMLQWSRRPCLEVTLAQILSPDFQYREHKFIECNRASVSSEKFLRKRDKKIHIMQILSPEMRDLPVKIFFYSSWGCTCTRCTPLSTPLRKISIFIGHYVSWAPSHVSLSNDLPVCHS